MTQKPTTDSLQDESGWTPLMISASVPDGERVLKVLLRKGADVNEKSMTKGKNLLRPRR